MSERTALRRKKERGVDDRASLDAILDEAIVAHVGFTADHGPVVLPMVYARIGDDLYLHGAAGNAMLRTLDAGGPVCVTVTLVDGLVLARSAFHHSANFRCAVIFGSVTRVSDLDEMRLASDALVEHIAHGRTAEVRPPNDTELRSTLMVRLPIDEWSVKVRTGPPIEEEEDLALPVWAGVLPLALTAAEPVSDSPEIPVPAHVYAHRLGQNEGTTVPS
jgi:nitroimidazol reductase NimA-like FMN-containing flavoprotein (pyridoxamine 5'-phosphate oxidase superfamily)